MNQIVRMKRNEMEYTWSIIERNLKLLPNFLSTELILLIELC